MIDDKDISRLNLNSSRPKISLVQQELALFADVIFKNFTFGKYGAIEIESH